MELKEYARKLNKIISRINGYYQKSEQQMGLNVYEVKVLYALYIDGLDTQKNIMEAYAMPKQTINNIITALTGKEYLEINGDKEDRRQKKLKLNEEGKAYASKLLHPLLVFEEAVAGRFGSERFVRMLALLEEYAAVLEQEMDERPKDCQDAQE